MRVIANKKLRAWLTLALASAGLTVFTGAPASAAAVSIDLCASTGQITMPDSVSVDVWGFVQTGSCAPDLVNDANFTPPVLSVNEGDVVTVNLSNALPAGHTLDFEIPGVSFDPGLADGSAPVVFTASAPGTYIYQSAGDAGRQEAMGLYGALVVRSNTANQAYDVANTAYDVEATLVLSQIDPAFNADPDNSDLTNYLATYWLINGKPYTGTSPGITAPEGQRLLLRYVNAGYDNTAMSLLGARESVVARDANLLNNPFSAAAETIPAGGTEDTIVTVPAYAGAPSANGFPLFNRNLHVTNGSTDAGTYSTPGGMLTFIHA